MPTSARKSAIFGLFLGEALASALDLLRQAKDLSDVAALIGYKPKNLGYILYYIPDSLKYTVFEIDKKGGGKREISAPIEQLKLVQRRVHQLLSRCLLEIEKAEGVKSDGILSHGFRQHYSIATNARNHRGRRWVFNLDLKDFFPSINFGRVRGYLIKNRHFRLNAKVATIIAQIACHENQLPQGSPTSPIVSNLLASMLDIKLNRLAARNRCTYTRYADDLTFSSNRKIFPREIASCVNSDTQEWQPSEILRYRIFQSGFRVNDAKTRMQFYWSRQDATGLVVNKKVNVKREYIKLARARCDRLFNTGACMRKFENCGVTNEEPFGLDQLQGMLAHIFQIKGDEFEHKRQNSNLNGKEHPGFYRTYRQFLDYRAFAANEIPTILFEGYTDSIYVKCALRAFANHYADLIDPARAKPLKVRLFRYSDTTDAVQHLNGGTGDLRQLIYNYSERTRHFSQTNFKNPVILVVDNDAGSKGRNGLFAAVKQVSKAPAVDGSKSFYHVWKNLYVVPTPMLGGGRDSMIEDFLPPAVLNVKLNGKTLHLSEKGFNHTKHFGKTRLAKYVQENRTNIDFAGYRPLLDAIVAAKAHYTP